MFFSQARRQSEGRRYTDLKIKLPPVGWSHWELGPEVW